MPHPDPGLAHDELGALDAFLASSAAPETAMGLSMLDGFFCSIALNPELILPSEWLPWVWDVEAGEAEPALANLAAAQQIIGLIMRHYNNVLTAVRAGAPEPIFSESAGIDGEVSHNVEDWAEGFLFGAETFAVPWWTQLRKQQPELLAPILLFATDEGLEALEEADEEKAESLLRGAPHMIVGTLERLQEYFAPLQKQAAEQRIAPHRRAGPKVGRNDPCPCGSGRKYKKCCGAPPGAL